MNRLLISLLLLAPLAHASPKDVFDPFHAHTLDLRLTPDGWDLIQPGAPAARKRATPNATREEGMTAGVRPRPNTPGGFAYVPIALTYDDRTTIVDAGLRLKGNSSYNVSAKTPRRPMKLDLDRFVERGRFEGLETLNLSNTTYDPSGARESLCFWLYRQLGVPAPRTGHALVTLTVPGKFDREYLGLYTLIEEVDDHFLKRHFGSAKGLLLKPSGMRGIAYLGDDWSKYEPVYKPRDPGRPDQRAKVIELARLTHRATDAEFRAKIGSVLAVDEFLRFVAVTSAIVNFDGFLSTGHNYFLYVSPADGLIHFIPWDVNMSFGVYGAVGTEDELARTSITRAYADHNVLVERVLAIDEYAAAYRAHVRTLATTAFNPAKLRERRERTAGVFAAADAAALRAGRAGSPTTRPAGEPGYGPPPDLWSFADRRADSIRQQLDGPNPGFKPEFNNVRRTLPDWAPLTVAAVTFMSAADTDKDWRLSDPEIAAAIARLFATAGTPPTGALDRPTATAAIDHLMPEDLRRRVPAKTWADWLITVADTDKDGRATAAELQAAYRRFQTPGDRDRDGRMDNRELIEALGAARAPRDPDPLR